MPYADMVRRRAYLRARFLRLRPVRVAAAIARKDARVQSALEPRFLSFIVPEPNSGCWLWSGKLTNSGYSEFWADGKGRLGHRVAYRLYRAEIPEGLEIDHLCRIPICVNPAHLEAVTHKVNQERGRGAKSHCKRGHEFDEANTAIVPGKKPGLYIRRCRACRRRAVEH